MAEATTAEKGQISINKIYEILAGFISKCEASLASAINKAENSTNMTQSQLLNLQAKVQTWGTIVATATGLVRGVGDTLMKITQNIR